MNKPFRQYSSRAAALIRDNVDTDAIIPSREMKSVSKHGLSDGLFAGWRYTDVAARVPDAEFVLNQPENAGVGILLSGRNFGCGSSREHAVWALAEYGFRAVIAESFSPIFRGNCIRNGIVPIALDPRPIVEAGLDCVEIDLPAQEVSVGNHSWHFEIDEEAKLMLTEGLDPISLTLLLEDDLAAREKADRQNRAWAFDVLGGEAA